MKCYLPGDLVRTTWLLGEDQLLHPVLGTRPLETLNTHGLWQGRKNIGKTDKQLVCKGGNGHTRDAMIGVPAVRVASAFWAAAMVRYLEAAAWRMRTITEGVSVGNKLILWINRGQ